MALGAPDGRAVVKTADGKMHVLKRGSSIPGSKAVVTQILGEKLVDEDSIDPNSEVKQTVWITKSSDSSGKAIVQRLNIEAPAQTAWKGYRVLRWDLGELDGKGIKNDTRAFVSEVGLPVAVAWTFQADAAPSIANTVTAINSLLAINPDPQEALYKARDLLLFDQALWMAKAPGERLTRGIQTNDRCRCAAGTGAEIMKDNFKYFDSLGAFK